jgi:predicted chitinase
MIISPPFLPDRAGSSEEAWLDAAMAQPASRLASTNAPEGSFPLSLKLGWHNGVHIQAPASGGAHLPVRAVADGKVVFVHAPTAPNNDLGHPLNYNPFHADTPTAAWTSDGFVVIEHRTDIGAEGDVATEVVYYSACMHMASIANCPKTAAPWAVGDAVCRKDALGTPGLIYGHEGQVHFEICCDEANLRRLTRRGPDWVDPLAMPPPTANGRVDSIFGSVYIYLPAAAPISTSMPTSQLRVANGSGGAASAGSGHFLPNTLHNPQWVQITCEKGAATLTSYDSSGARIGAPRSDSRYDYIGGAGASAAVKAAASQSFEYDLYAVCNDRHGALNAAPRAASSPSGWYELLRFGRNLGPDPLPANAAHWRKIVTPAGELWADLNAPGTFKFSDADFLPVMGWNCFDDDPNADLRCDSLRMKTLIRDPDPKNEQRMERAELARRLGDASVRTKLRRTICKFPSEWDRTTIEARYGWLETEDFKTADDDAAGAQKWDRFVKHARAVTFADLPKAFLDADWRFHPREFVGLMRKCGWLSEREVKQLIPLHALRFGRAPHSRALGHLWEPIADRNASPRSNPVLRDHRIPLNRMMRKYFINTPMRQVSFFGNAIQETGWLGALDESGGSTYWYTPWHGRGFLQLTHASNYLSYWAWRGRHIPVALKTALETAQATEQGKLANLRSMTAMQDANFSGLTLEMQGWRAALEAPRQPPAAENTLAPTDSAGFYWASLRLAQYADGVHVLERVVVNTINGQGAKVYYRSPAFWQTSAGVNLPASIANTYNHALNGFDSRCCAYGYAIAVLTEEYFPDDRGLLGLAFPEGYLPRSAE